MSPKKSFSSEFWLTITAIILAAFINVCITKYTIEEQVSRPRASQVLREISDAINRVCEQLESHASMYTDMEICSQYEGNPEKCWFKKYAFQPLAAQRAWFDFDSTINAAMISIKKDEARKILGEVKKIGEDHPKKLRPLLGPRTIEEVSQLRSKILNTRSQLLENLNRLRESLMKSLE